VTWTIRTMAVILMFTVYLTGCATHKNSADQQSKETTEAEVLGACIEVGTLDLEFAKKDAPLTAIDHANKKVLGEAQTAAAQGKANLAAGMRQIARNKTKEHMPEIQAAISSMPRIQKDLESKTFASTLPVEAREILDLYSKSTAHLVEVETTRALAMSAFAERGDLAPMKAMYNIDNTYSDKFRADYQPIKEAFDKLCHLTPGK